ncbi:MAG: hypothetical protein R3C26_18140 [Calditrichia bacterium]
MQRTLIMLMILFNLATAQTSEAELRIKQAGEIEQVLVIGFSPDATDGIDIGIDVLSPPPSPGFFSQLQWKNEGYFKDMRNAATSPDTFRVRYWRNGGGQIVVRWNSATLPANHNFRITDDFNLNTFSLDMRSADSLVVDNHPILFDQLRIIAQRQPLLDDFGAISPNEFWLAQNFPNPFKLETVIHTNCRSVSVMMLKIVDLRGQTV